MLRTPPAWVKKGGAAGQDEAPYLMQMAAEPAAPYGGKRSKGRRAPDATRVEELLANILVRLERLEQSRRLGPGALASTNSGGATTKSS
ncbi:MAG TPA: hypothetical protein PKE21_13735 [Flavobacteriales bacterium]|nr:hypothetical protein [Flavobacteriales bacterium]